MPTVHLRVLTSGDAAWVVEADRQGGELARRQGWDSEEKLAAQLDEGSWASGSRFAWAVVADGEPVGFALVRGLEGPDAEMEIRISPDARGRGAGREVLRQVADHHFADNPGINRLTGRTHEQNVPMQRAFAAAGFRMEARYRDSYRHADGTPASEWGYALTRADWEAERHRRDDPGYDLHGLTFEVEAEDDGDGPWVGATMRFLQEGRRVLARYDGEQHVEGELAGILLRDVVSYRYVHEVVDGAEERGGGRCRLQRRHDGRLELVDEWTGDHGRSGERRLVERR